MGWSDFSVGMICTSNRMVDYIAVQNSRNCRADFKLVGNLGLIGPAVTGILHCNVINHAINQKKKEKKSP